jgi:hypothetical protein
MAASLPASRRRVQQSGIEDLAAGSRLTAM